MGREIDDQRVPLRTERSVGNKKRPIYFYASIALPTKKKSKNAKSEKGKFNY